MAFLSYPGFGGYNAGMDLHLRLPEEVVEALGPEPEREALEGVLLLLVKEGRVTVERAGKVLGLGDREEAMRWYVARSSLPQDPEVGDSEVASDVVHLEDLTQEEFDRLDRSLKITPDERGSGFSDVSINHDKYLYGDAS